MITAEKILMIDRNLMLRPMATLVERGILLDEADYAIAYQMCFNKVPKKDKEIFDADDAYDIDFVFYDKATSKTVDLSALYEVFDKKSLLNEILTDVKTNWKTKVEKYVTDWSDHYKSGWEFTAFDMKAVAKKALLPLEFLLKKYFPSTYSNTPKNLFSKG